MKGLASVPEISHPILLNSIPKAGSNLLHALVSAMPGCRRAGHVQAARELPSWQERLQRLQDCIRSPEPGSIYTGHIPYAPPIAQWLREQGIKQFFIYRDPRDTSVSLQHFVLTQTQAVFYPVFARLGNDAERLMAIIQGVGRGRAVYTVSASAYPSVRLDFEAYLGWLGDSQTYALRYEDLVSSVPGQRAQTAAATLVGMLAHIGLNGYDPHDPRVEAILQRGMDPAQSYTFRRGVCGGWREAYTAEHTAAFRTVAGDLLERLGYAE